MNANNYETVSIKEAKDFFSSKFETSKKSLTNQYYIAETDSIYQESIIQSDKKLTIIPAKTIFKNHFSRILLLKIDGEIKSVIVSMQHEEQSLSDKFSGAIIITNLNGAYITGYKIDNGIVKYQIANKKISNKTHSSKSDEGGCLYHETTNPECYFCITNALNEVVIIAEKDTNQGLDPMNGGGGGDPNPVLWDPGDGFPPGGGNNNNSCPLGKVKDENTGKCVCPEGKKENSDGDCVTPCDTSKEDLKKVFPNTSDDKLQKIADAINKYGKDFGIDTKEKLQHFLAQAGHESDEFKTFSEYTNYRVKKLHTIFKKHFNPYDDPKKDLKKQNPEDYEVAGSIYAKAEKLFNFVYDDANRGKKYKLGNTSIGDGYKYRGRGIFQLTGKDNYSNFNIFYQENYDSNTNLISNPDLIATNMDIAVISALWYYDNKLEIDIDSETTVSEVTEEVNGGENGIDDRKNKFNKAKINIDCL
jgi:putative chitinase